MTIRFVVAWRQTGDTPLPEPMMIMFRDTITRHQEYIYIYINTTPR